MVRFREKSQDGDLRTWMMLLVQWYDTANVDENSFDRWLKGDIKGELALGLSQFLTRMPQILVQHQKPMDRKWET